MTDIPKLGKILCILSVIVFTIACAYIIKQNTELRRDGDRSKKRLAEIIVSSVLTGVGLIATVFFLWEFV